MVSWTEGVQNKNAGTIQQIPQGSAVGQIVAIDIVGPQPITARNNRYIETIMDPIVVENIFADTIAVALFGGRITWFGVLNLLLSDHEPIHFTPNEELVGLMRVEKLSTSAYHPHTHGTIERFYRYLGTKLTAASQLPIKRTGDLRLQNVI